VPDDSEAIHGIAETLKQLRRDAGFSTYQLARRLGFSQTKASRLENGTVTPDPRDVQAWCTATGASAQITADLIAAAEPLVNPSRSYRQAHSQGVASRQDQIAAIIARCSRYRSFALAEVPGMLQTSLYATEILTMADTSGKRDIGLAVERRMRRQELLYDPAVLCEFEFVIAEWAFGYQAGPAEVMQGQAARIIDVMARPNVQLNVVPNGTKLTTVALSGFVMYTVPDEGTWVLVEHLTGEVEIHAAEDVAVYEDTFEQMKAAAVTGTHATAILRAAANLT
jgi:transcriptional regulator with XRE-family HTH domain